MFGDNLLRRMWVILGPDSNDHLYRAALRQWNIPLTMIGRFLYYEGFCRSTCHGAPT